MRTILLAAAAAVVLTPLAASAAPAPQERTLTFEYIGTTGGVVPGRGSLDLGCLPMVTVINRRLSSCARFETEKGERTLVLRAGDTSGAPAGFRVRIGDKTAGDFCGKATLALPKAASTPVTVQSFNVSQPGCSGVATTGKLTATLSRR